MTKLYRRSLSIILALVMLLTLSLSGCGSRTDGGSTDNSTGGGSTDSSTDGGSTNSRKAKDTLIVAKNEDISSLDPAAAINQKSFTIYSQMLEGLVRYNCETKEVDPCLATEWEQIDDVTWHFTLREGVKFHDGNTMTSEDVVFSFERIMNSGLASSYVDYIEKIEADGDYAVTMTLKMPYAQVIQALTYPAAMILSKAAVEAAGEDFALAPVGTGPYKFVDRLAADSITMEAFDEYWGEQAKTKNLIFKIIPEGSQRTIMLENGEADIICDVLANDASRIDESTNLSLVHETGYKYYAFYIKCNSSTPVGDKRVRQAIEYAIDKQSIVDAVMSGYGQVGSLLTTPAVVGYSAEKDRGNVYDVDKAKELLAAAGYADGFALDVYVRSGQVYEEIATIMQDQLSNVGININLIVMESNKITDQFYAGEEIPMYNGFYNNICGDTDFIMQKLLPTTFGIQYYSEDDMIVDILNRARAEVDPDKRQAIYDEFHDLTTEDVPQICLFYEEILMGMSNNVEGFQMNPLGAHQYASVAVYE